MFVLSYIVYNQIFNQIKKSNSIANDLGDKIQLKAILFVSLPLLFAQSSQFLMSWTDRLMLGGMTSSYEVGIYDVAFKLSMFVNIALTAVTSISSPKFAELYEKKDFNRLEKVVHQSTKLIFWSSIPLLVLFTVVSIFILDLFGDDFYNGIYALVILCTARLFSVFTGPAGNLLQMTGNQLTYMNVLFLGAAINIVLNYVFIQPENPFSHLGIHGINGAAFASFISIIFWNLTMVYYVKRKFGFLQYIFSIFKKMTKNNLPNLLIVGAAKSGTTSLHNYLNQHPEIFMSHHKEPHFLISNEIGEMRIPNSILEISDYSDLFDHSDDFKYKGESSVMYLLYPDIAINNIKKFLGKECKIIIMLRNPIDRAFSGYQHVKRYNTMENLSFEDALWNSDDRYHNNPNMTPASRYLALGKYYLQVKKFKESFKNVHIIIYDDYKNDINKELNHVINFLKLKLLILI